MSANERGLGRGLDALFRNVNAQPETVRATPADGMEPALGPKNQSDGVRYLPIAALSPSQGQPRMTFDQVALEELAASIRSQGIVQALLVRPFQTETATIYEIVAGERRWRAAQLAGLEEVPVFIKTMSDEDALTAALIENLQREDLNPLEEALAIESLRERFPLGQEELAKKLGKSRSAVSNSLRLLQLPEEMREALRGGSLSPGHARALLALPDEDLQREVFAAIIQGQLSVRDAEAAVVHWKRHNELPASVTGLVAGTGAGAGEGRQKSARAPKPEAIKTLIKHLRLSVHPKASIAGTEALGRVTIPYESPEQLASLMALLGKTDETIEGCAD